jgi:hexosaminidase
MQIRTSWLALSLVSSGFACGLDSTPTPSCTGTCAAPLTQAGLEALAVSIELRLEIVENAPADCPSSARLGFCHAEKLTLTQHGPAFDGRGWALYLTNQHRVLSVTPGELGLAHVNGSLHVIEPTPAFRGFPAEGSKEIALRADGCWLAESDGMPRAYLTAPGLTPVVLANTDTEDASGWLAPLVTEAQTQCSGLAEAELATAESRFDVNSTLRDPGATAVARELIPRPAEISPDSGVVDLSSGLDVQAPALSAATLELIAERLNTLGVSVTASGRAVRVSIDSADMAFAGRSGAEAYRMSIRDGGVEIVGGDAAGAFHGVQTLLALIVVEPGVSRALPVLEVPYDAPRYGYRALQIDVARNFHGLPVLARVLKQMAAYKLDALHLHLSDDEGFRLEIPGLPELTEVGSRRCHDLEERSCLLPQLGSGPTADTSGSGHLSRDEFIALLRLATALHIEVIPEFDLPGHAHAAIRSMAARAANGDSAFSLSDPGDTSAYVSVQGYTDNVVSACVESTYAFVARLMDEVLAMYQDSGAPLRTWHIGADEIPAGAWEQSPACQALVESGELQGTEDARGYFLRRINSLAQQRGLGIRLWSEGVTQTVFDSSGPVSMALLDPASDFAGNAVSVNWYSPLRYFDAAPAPLARAGYQVVLGSADYLYIDNTAEADPKEPGSYWSTRFLDTHKLFSFIPGNLAANTQLSKDCEEGTCDYFFDGAEPIPSENILGVETAQWSETVRSDEQLESMLFPRLLAFAERAWHRAEWEPQDGMDRNALIDRTTLDADWQRFASTLAHEELPALERAGIHYRVEVPGARIRNGVLEANAPLPSLALEYQDATGQFVPYDPAQPPVLSSTQVRVVMPDGRAGRALATAEGAGLKGRP